MVGAAEPPDLVTMNNAHSSHYTDFVDPKIAIDKVANPKSANPGDTVTYTYSVTNPGDSALSDVVVTDDKCSPVTFTGGDTDGDGDTALADLGLSGLDREHGGHPS